MFHWRIGDQKGTRFRMGAEEVGTFAGGRRHWSVSKEEVREGARGLRGEVNMRTTRR